jgi:hypothetical protein
MPTPETCRTIFISHANDDDVAKPIYDALCHGLESLLGPTHAGYRAVHDGQLRLGDDWEQRILGWLENCEAAVLLISPKALRPDYPWVAFEAWMASRRARRYGGRIITVLAGISQVELDQHSLLKQCRLTQFQLFICKDPVAEAEAVAAKIAEDLRVELTALPDRELVGLDAELEIWLRGFDSRILTLALAEGGAESLPDRLTAREAAILLLSLTDRGRTLAFHRLCREARGDTREHAKSIARILSCAEVPSQAALRMAVEAIRDPVATRALLLDTAEDEVLRSYVAAAAGTAEPFWCVLPSTDQLPETYSARLC